MSLYVCDSDHEQICHEGWDCPMCKMVQDKRELQQEIDELKERLEAAKEPKNE